MVDDLEEKSSEGFDLQHYLGVVRRRHMQFLIPAALGLARGVGSQLGSPASYQSEHPDSGGTADHAEELRHAERER